MATNCKNNSHFQKVYPDWWDDEEIPALVIDNGSLSIKTGFAGDDMPKLQTPSIIAKSINNDDSKTEHTLLSLEYPIQHGIITNFDHMETLWYNILCNELNVSPEEHPILLSEPALNPKINREKTVEIMFETFNIPSTYIARQAVLSFYTKGRGLKGVVLDIGHGVTQIVPIYGGYGIQHAEIRKNFSGNDITEYLMKSLSKNNFHFSTTLDRECIRQMKDSISFVNVSGFEKSDHDEKCDAESYKLPDGSVINVGNERFECAEILFDPTLIGVNDKGVHKLVYESVMNCAIDIRKDIFGGIWLSGGTTCMTNFNKRLANDITDLISDTMTNTKVRVISSTEKQIAVWIGGSILACLSNFSGMWITACEYDEDGSRIVHRKCF